MRFFILVSMLVATAFASPKLDAMCKEMEIVGKFPATTDPKDAEKDVVNFFHASAAACNEVGVTINEDRMKIVALVGIANEGLKGKTLAQCQVQYGMEHNLKAFCNGFIVVN